ncbi:hypothetical protein F5Y15DRAFT_147223 [Xylariaceae sp. FL0016]|nr:hypothetical protein F5Y15DRAFT_147223 [Xylariaceae sp. FL0016]
MIPRNVGQSDVTGDIPPAVWATLDHSSDIGPSIAAAVVCMVLAVTFVLLRVYTRWSLIHQMGPDDYMAIASLCGVLAVGIIQCVHTKYGLGSHIYDVARDGDLPMFFRTFWSGVVFYQITLLCVKTTLFLQYYRFIKQVGKYRHIYLTIMGLVVCWSISQIFTMIFLCVPVQGYWDKSVPAQCLPETTVQITNAVGNIITDVIVLLLPMPIVWRLNIKPAQKYSLIGIFSLGFFTCIVSILRLVRMRMLEDMTIDSVPVSCWSLAELTTGVVCSTLPMLRPLAKKYIPVFRSTMKASREKISWDRRYGRSHKTDTESGPRSTHPRSMGSEVELKGEESGFPMELQRSPSDSLRLPIDGAVASRSSSQSALQ